MDGDFKGDFTRDTFDPLKAFSRVLMQQGRVQLDADLNEQADILLRYLHHLARDVVGPHGGPADDLGFAIDGTSGGDFSIGAGDYYVDGILVENEPVDEKGDRIPFPYSYKNQPYTPPPEDLASNKTYLAYLDVWERQITFIEDDSIREVALNGPDTATRGQVVWQVNVWPFDSDPCTDATDKRQCWTQKLRKWQQANHGHLIATTNKNTAGNTDACITPPDARFRRAENQLYRVEIHRGGLAWESTPASTTKQKMSTKGSEKRSGGPGTGGSSEGATFKWSRENSSVVFVISNTGTIQGDTVKLTLENLGRDGSHLTLEKDDWVEIIVYDDQLRPYIPGPLVQIAEVDRTNTTVTLSKVPNINLGKLALLRRWDQSEGEEEEPLELVEGAVKVIENTFITLEDGIQIQFQPGDPGNPSARYRSGDYWLIPARVAIGDIEWPGEKEGNPKPLPPHGIVNHYAPLAIIAVDTWDNVSLGDELRYQFKTLVELSQEIGSPL